MLSGISVRAQAKIKNRDRIGLLFILPHFIGVGMFFLIPYADVILKAFQPSASGGMLGNFLNVLQNKAFQLAMKNSLKFIVVCIPLILTLSLSIALVLHNQKKYVHIWKRCYLMPLAIPVVSVALMWNFLFSYQGVLNGFLHMLGLNSVDWMNSGTAFFVLAFSYLWKNLGYYIVLWLAALTAIPQNLYEAARIDRADNMQCFRYITFPFLRPSFYMVGVLALVNSFKVFREAYLVAGAYPHNSIYLLQHLFNNWFRDLEVEKMAAGAVINSIAVLVLIFVLKRIDYAEAEKL